MSQHASKAACNPAIATILGLPGSKIPGICPGISGFKESLPVPPTRNGFKEISPSLINPPTPNGP